VWNAHICCQWEATLNQSRGRLLGLCSMWNAPSLGERTNGMQWEINMLCGLSSLFPVSPTFIQSCDHHSILGRKKKWSLMQHSAQFKESLALTNYNVTFLNERNCLPWASHVALCHQCRAVPWIRWNALYFLILTLSVYVFSNIFFYWNYSAGFLCSIVKLMILQCFDDRKFLFHCLVDVIFWPFFFLYAPRTTL
jgi:hypothetical protein